MYEPPQLVLSHHPRISVFVVGLSLSLFLTISYVLCVIGYLVLPGLPIEHSALAIFLPGFALLTWPSFVLGAIESFAGGWYIALIFSLRSNFFAGRRWQSVAIRQPMQAGVTERRAGVRRLRLSSRQLQNPQSAHL